MNSNFPAAVPVIPVSDLAAAIDHYMQHLGFTLDWGDRDLGLAGISKGDCRMFLADQNYRKGHGNAGPVMTWLNLNSRAEVDELYRVWADAGAPMMSAPETKSWGLFEFTATDPDGNLFRVFYDFATPERENKPSIEGLAPQLRTTDMTSSIRFYTEKLGFSVEFNYQDFYAGIRAGNQLIHLKLVDEKDPSIDYVNEGGHLHLYFETENVQALADRLRSTGVALVQDVHDTAWSTREIVINDDQGHTLYFGEPL